MSGRAAVLHPVDAWLAVFDPHADGKALGLDGRSAPVQGADQAGGAVTDSHDGQVGFEL